MKNTITRVAIPAHIYIAVETPDTYSDERIIAEAKARIAEVMGDDYLKLSGFEPDEHALVYVNDNIAPSIEDRDW